VGHEWEAEDDLEDGALVVDLEARHRPLIPAIAHTETFIREMRIQMAI